MAASYISRTYIDIAQQIERDYLMMIQQCLHVNKSSRSYTFVRRDNQFLIKHRVYCVTSCAYCSSGDSVARETLHASLQRPSVEQDLFRCADKAKERKLIKEH